MAESTDIEERMTVLEETLDGIDRLCIANQPPPFTALWRWHMRQLIAEVRRLRTQVGHLERELNDADTQVTALLCARGGSDAGE